MRNPDAPAAIRKIRCAIYTRKSTEEGLEQDFNSLHAQREACEAYIASQKHEGWVLLPQPYDDGGISGGTLARPGVQQLLDDVDAGLVDQIVVYKVDRLTRSLTDFSKLVERLDTAGASFVSVTQSFNTATSMGRLTLNMLLSFAQFEREVTAERIRDKIAASKAKGMWMGGQVPYGYAQDGRTLKINEAEAANVRLIFGEVAAGTSILELAAFCQTRGIRTRVRTRANGEAVGGLSFTRGHLYQLVNNPVYRGKIRHKGKIHKGQHKAIINRELWDQVQSILTERSNGERNAIAYRKSKAPLLGKLVDTDGIRFVATSSRKNGLRYDYYINKPNGDAGQATPSAKVLRYRSSMIEVAIGNMVVPFLRTHLAGSAVFKQAGEIVAEDAKTWIDLVERLQVQPGTIKISFTSDLGIDLPHEVAFTMRRKNHEQRIVIEGQDNLIDKKLLSNIAIGKTLYRLIKKGATHAEAASQLGMDQKWAGRLLQLSFLSPHIVEQACMGKLQPTINTASFVDQAWPSEFKAQVKMLEALS